MKLSELINFTPTDTKQNVTSYNSNVQNKTTANKIGSGAFGTAYDTSSNKRLNQVTKVAKAGQIGRDSDNIDDDGYLAYIKEIDRLSSIGIKNPYFLKVHDLKVLKNKSGNLIYRINLEKLISFRSPLIAGNEELMNSLHHQMFNDNENLVYDASDILMDVNRALYEPTLVKDKRLLDALKTIKTVLQSNSNFFQDMHGGNIMWRITGTIPQLVILDPIAS